MKAQSLSARLGFFLAALGVFLVVIGLHFKDLALLPGLHYDEAWAAKFSFDIAFEKGFWPWAAMSAYTSPWTHYFTALVFKIFGASVWTYRASYLFWSLLGLVFFAFTLGRLMGLRRARIYFLLLAGTSPALVSNHRFAVELNALLPFCAGFFFLAWTYRSRFPRMSQLVMGVALIVGTTSHILFLALPLALVLTVLWTQSELRPSQRRFFLTLSALFLIFFIRTLFGNSWPSKSYALILASSLFFLWAWDEAYIYPFFRRRRKVILYVLLLPFLIYFFNFLVFLEGSWGLRFHKGEMRSYLPTLLSLVLMLGLWFWGLDQRIFSKRERLFLFFLVFCLGALMITPAPRYFEIAFLFFFAGLVRILACLPLRLGVAATALLAGLNLLSLKINYFIPNYVDQDFRFFLLKDSSYDFIPKSAVGDFLHARNCSYADLRSQDLRSLLAFRTLALFEKKSGELRRCELQDTLNWTRESERPAKTPTETPRGTLLWEDSSSVLEGRKTSTLKD